MSTHNSLTPQPPLPPQSAARHREWKLGCKVYIGNLAEGASKSDIEEAFNKYGPLRNVWVARNPPGFAFVEFEDGRDAEDACRHLDGTRIAGGRIKAEMSHGRTRRGRGSSGPGSFRHGPPPPPPIYSSMNGHGHGYHGGPPIRGGPYHPPPPRSGYGYSNGDYHHDGYVPHPPHHHPHHHHSHHNSHAGYRGHHGAPAGLPINYYDRPSRHVPRPRSPLSNKDAAYRYSRSRSNSLGKSPPPQPQAPPPQAQPPASSSSSSQPTRTARPRTPPSESPSP